MTALRIAGQTDVGRHRQDNQDTFVTSPLWSADAALLLVIDGVGGYAGGAQAASLAQEAIVQYMAAPTGDTLTMLREAVVYANNQIVRHRQQDANLARMCCVLTVAVADAPAGRLLYAHVGDTRLYRFRNGQLTKLTHDHSLVGVREDASQLTEREAMQHPRRNEILRDVGSMPHRVDDPDFLESDETDFLPGDVLLLCSDGLTDRLTRAQLTDVLTRPVSVEEQVTELIRQANEEGGQDNITVVLAQYAAPIANTVITDPPIPPSADTESTPVLMPVAPTEVAQTEVAANEADSVLKPAPVRKWVQTLLLLLLILLLAGVLWWQHESAVSTPSPQRSPADSTVNRNQLNQPDSGRTP